MAAFSGIGYYIGKTIGKSKKKFIRLVVAVTALLLLVTYGRTYVRRHFRTVEVERQSLVQTETIDMKGKKESLYISPVWEIPILMLTRMRFPVLLDGGGRHPDWKL